VNFARRIREIGRRFGLKRFLSAHRRPFRDEGECFPSVPGWPEPLRGGLSAWKLDRIALRALEAHVSVFRITNIFQCQKFFGISMDWASDSPTGPIRPFSWQSDLRFLSPFSASSYSACRTAAMRAWSNTRGGRSRCNKDAKAQRVRSIPLVRRKVTGSEEFLSRRHSLLSTT